VDGRSGVHQQDIAGRDRADQSRLDRLEATGPVAAVRQLVLPVNARDAQLHRGIAAGDAADLVIASLREVGVAGHG